MIFRRTQGTTAPAPAADDRSASVRFAVGILGKVALWACVVTGKYPVGGATAVPSTPAACHVMVFAADALASTWNVPLTNVWSGGSDRHSPDTTRVRDTVPPVAKVT